MLTYIHSNGTYKVYVIDTRVALGEFRQPTVFIMELILISTTYTVPAITWCITFKQRV